MSDLIKTTVGKDRGLKNMIKITGKFFLSVIVFYFLFYVDKYGHNTILVYGSFIIVALCVLGDLLLIGGIDVKKYHVGIWINFIMVIYSALIGSIVAYDKSNLLYSVQVVFQYSFIIFAIYHFSITSSRGMDWFFNIIIISALISCFFILDNPYKMFGRYSLSSLDNPNMRGVVLTLGVFSVTFKMKPTIKNMMPSIALIVLFLYCIILGGSRKSMVAVLIIVLFSIYEFIKELRRALPLFQSMIILVVFIAVIILAVKQLWNFYQDSHLALRMDSMVEDESQHIRIRFYKLAWEIFRDKPFFGGGLDQFKYWSEVGGYSHATYPEAISDFGFVGSVLYFFPIILTGYQTSKKALKRKASYTYRLIFSLWLVEMFLGTGQIFFLEIVHYFAWGIIYFYIHDRESISEKSNCKYIR